MTKADKALLLMDAKDESEFWARVQIGAPNECWIWTGAKNSKGYGAKSLQVEDSHPGTTSVSAHRIALYLKNRVLPTVAMHCCDTPSCCNPAHLKDGTVAENNYDTRHKGRAKYGWWDGKKGKALVAAREKHAEACRDKWKLRYYAKKESKCSE